jgi:hypothetical protein
MIESNEQTAEYAGIDYAALPVNCSIFVMSLCGNIFRMLLVADNLR